MKTSEMIKELCKEEKISLAEVARLIGQSPQNFNKKLKRDTLTTEELIQIGKVMGAKFEQAYILTTGKRIALPDVSIEDMSINSRGKSS